MTFQKTQDWTQVENWKSVTKRLLDFVSPSSYRGLAAVWQETRENESHTLRLHQSVLPTPHSHNFYESQSSYQATSPLLQLHNEIIATIVYQCPPSSRCAIYHFQCGVCDCLHVHHVDEHGRSISSVETKQHAPSAARPYSSSVPAVCNELVQDWTLSGPLKEGKIFETFDEEDNKKENRAISSTPPQGRHCTYIELFQRLVHTFINTL
jgi:hypothetical protein